MTKTNKTTSMAELSWLPKKTFELTFTIPWSKVKTQYDLSLKKLAEQVTVKGFRKGKAPVKLVEKQLEPKYVYEEVLKQLLPDYFSQAVKDHGLRPIVAPKVEILKSGKDQDWTFKATACEMPEVKVDGFEKVVKAANATSKIWTPGSETAPQPDQAGDKTKNDPQTAQTKQNQKLSQVFKTLLEAIKIELPDMLVEEEVGHKLSGLLNQINRLGVTLDQYLASAGKTVEQLKQDYRRQTEETLKLELILQGIAQKQAITVEDKAIDDMIAKAPDEQTKKNLNQPMQRAYLKSTLIKQQVVDFLLKL